MVVVDTIKILKFDKKFEIWQNFYVEMGPWISLLEYPIYYKSVFLRAGT